MQRKLFITGNNKELLMMSKNDCVNIAVKNNIFDSEKEFIETFEDELNILWSSVKGSNDPALIMFCKMYNIFMD